MPLIYAVEEPHPTIQHGPNRVEYIPVTREVAEAYERGCYALSNEEGERCSPWALLQQEVPPQKDVIRSEPVKDTINQTLLIGDYVGLGPAFAGAQFGVGRVVGFTAKQVRVLPMTTRAKCYSKLHYEQSLIRLPEALWR